jgi:hypothetical protein
MGEVLVSAGADDASTTDGAVVSRIRFLDAPSDPLAPGAGRVSEAGFWARSSNVAPVRAVNALTDV